MAVKMQQYKQTEYVQSLIKNITLKNQTSFLLFPESSLGMKKNQAKTSEKNRVIHILFYIYIQNTFFSKRQNFF